MAGMRLLDLHTLPGETTPTPVLVLALDGWTDAGAGGSEAATWLRTTMPSTRLGAFPPDSLYDYRDRRPVMRIDQGRLEEPEWPRLVVDLLTPAAGPPLLLVSGGEPDFAWQTIAGDLTELAERLGITRYVGLGSVPGPTPHTRPVAMVCTSSDEDLLERIEHPHEEMTVPASAQVLFEQQLGAAGLQTLGMWARVPHYVAGEYPAASRALLQRLSSHLGTPIEGDVLEEEIEETRERLDLAAQGSDEVTEHIQQLEELYDAEQARAESEGGAAGPGLPGSMGGPLPSGEEIADEVERFLRGRRD